MRIVSVLLVADFCVVAEFTCKCVAIEFACEFEFYGIFRPFALSVPYFARRFIEIISMHHYFVVESVAQYIY